MGKTIAITYVIIFFVSIFTIVITRLILIFRLYAIKDGKIFDKSAEGEIISFLASMTLPFKIKEDPNDIKTFKITQTLNKLKSAYWWLMLTLLIFIVTMNVLEHGFNIKLAE
ncbi:MAG: hypothetical protein IPP56_09525 [Bacteroidetes bacterium]|nr:hypothetical protein [Bacteroidota bacterium]MBK9799927.1 hypothetical protein [Bacteroidota bacterium]